MRTPAAPRRSARGRPELIAPRRARRRSKRYTPKKPAAQAIAWPSSDSTSRPSGAAATPRAWRARRSRRLHRALHPAHLRRSRCAAVEHIDGDGPVHLRGQPHEQPRHPARSHRAADRGAPPHAWSPRRWTTSSWTAHGVRTVLVFNAIPIDRHKVNRRSSQLALELVEDGWHLLIYPEGGPLARRPDSRSSRAARRTSPSGPDAPVIPVLHRGRGRAPGARSTPRRPSTSTRRPAAPPRHRRLRPGDALRGGRDHPAVQRPHRGRRRALGREVTGDATLTDQPARLRPQRARTRARVERGRPRSASGSSSPAVHVSDDLVGEPRVHRQHRAVRVGRPDALGAEPVALRRRCPDPRTTAPEGARRPGPSARSPAVVLEADEPPAVDVAPRGRRPSAARRASWSRVDEPEPRVLVVALDAERRARGSAGPAQTASTCAPSRDARASVRRARAGPRASRWGPSSPPPSR